MLSKTALAAGLVGATALGLVGVGSFAAFSTNGSVTQQISSGTLQVNLKDLNNPTNNVNVSGDSGATLTLKSVGDLAPGDTFQDVVQISNNGSVPAQLTSVSYDVGPLPTSADQNFAKALSASATLTSTGGVTNLPSGTLSIGPGDVTANQTGTLSLTGDDVVIPVGATITATITVTYSSSATNTSMGGTATPSLNVGLESATS